MSRDPLRAVVKADFREGQAMNRLGITMRWWDLYLECGHFAERKVRFPRQTVYRRGFAALYHPRPRSEVLPAPKRVRCRDCGRNSSETAT